MTEWPGKQFMASAVAGMINDPSKSEAGRIVRDFLLPGAMAEHAFTSKAVGRLLKKHIDEPVRSGKRTLVLRRDLVHMTKRIYIASTLSFRKLARSLRVCGGLR